MTDSREPADLAAFVRGALSRAHNGVEPEQQLLEAASLSADPKLVATALIAKGTYLIVSHELSSLPPVLDEIDRVLESDRSLLSSSAQWSWFSMAAIHCAQSLDLVTAEHHLKNAIALGDQVSGHRRTNALLQLGRCYIRQDRLGDAVETMALLRHQNLNLSISGLLIEGHLAELFQKHDHWERSRTHLQAALAPGAFDQPMARTFFGSQLVSTLVELDEIEEARAVSRDVRKNAVITGWTFSMALADFADSRVALADGDVDRALDGVAAALHVMRSTGNQYEEMGAILHQARTLISADRHREAETVLDDPRVSVMGPLFVCKVERLLAECCRAGGRWAEVVEHQAEVRKLEDTYSVGFPDLYSMLMERHRLDEAGRQRLLLDDANARLTAAHAEQDELRSIVAHDLKSPLTALGLTLEFLALQTNEERARVRLATASETVSRVRQITSQLSALKELDAGSVEFVIEPVQLGPVIEQTARQFESAAQAKGIELTIESTQSHWEQLVVCADVARLGQVLDNLVSNALKYSPRDTRVRIQCGSKAEPSAVDIALVEISVVDEGLGLSAEDLAGLFAKYGRLSSRPTGNETSSGIGLFIAQSFAQSMGGVIGATSTGKGEGSTFVLSLPAAEGQPACV